MPEPPGAPDCVSFDGYSVSRRTRVLSKSGDPIAIQPLQLDLLLYLIEHRDRVVTQEDLIRDVWGGTHVQEQALRYALHCVRRAVGDDGERQRVIKTILRKGVRFVAPVSEGSGSRSGYASASFLGRDHLLAAVDGALDEIGAGNGGQVLLASGEAGVGKTSLLHQIVRVAGSKGFSTAEVRCDAAAGGAAYWPWVQAIRALLKQVGLRPAVEAILSRTPELRWAFPEHAVRAAEDVLVDASTARSRLFDAMTSLMVEIAGVRPVVVCMDDLHEADDDTLKLACHLGAVAPRAPILFAYGFRDRPVRMRESWAVSTARLASGPGVLSLPLRGLSPDALGAMVADRFGVQPSEPVLSELHAKTAGNPFFAIQLMNVLREEKRLGEVAGSQLPSVSFEGHVQEVIAKQAALLPEEARGLLDLASVIGNEFPLALVAAAARLDQDEVVERLEPAFASGVLSDAGSASACRFVHPLLREALYSGIPVKERRDLHRRVAHALESLVGDDPSEGSWDLARHFAETVPHEDSLKAVRYFLGASDRDVGCAAFDSAKLALESAAAVAESLYVRDKGLWCDIRLRMGVVYGLLSEREKSRRMLKQAASDGLEVGRRDVVCDAALAFSPDLLAVETGVRDDELVDLLRMAVFVARSESDPVLPRLLVRLAVALHWCDEAVDEVPRLVAEARRIAAGHGDEGVVEFVDVAGQMALYSPGCADPRTVLGGRRSGRDVSSALMRGVLRVTGLLELADVRAAEIETERFAADVDRFKNESARWYPGMFAATIDLLRGDYGAVAASSDAYLQQGMAVEDRNAFHSFVLQRSMMAVDVGGLEDLENGVARMVSEYPSVEGWDAGLCYLRSEVGRRSEAREGIERLVRGKVLENVPRNAWLGTIGCLALASRNLGDTRYASELYELWKPHSGRLAVVGYGSFCWGAGDRFLGVLAGMLGDRDSARSHLEAACALNAGCGARPALAHCLRDRGRFEVAWGGEAGRGPLTKALALARELGMTRLVGQLESDLAGLAG